VITTKQIASVYNKRSGIYDLSNRLYPFIGFRFEAYRRRGIERLDLQPGDTVVDLGCGTGLNFKPILDRIGPEGEIIGVDVSEGMLDRAEKRIAYAGWQNIDLLACPMETFAFPDRVNAVITTGALGFASDPAALITRAAQALSPHGRLLIVDLKHPETWPAWLFRFYFVTLGKPFAVTPEYVADQPWIVLDSLFEQVSFEEAYGGAVYIAWGKGPRS
jgi:ubiquinone/menaquinone biosynthesis C-methylase UbiE